jgi:hypothetical protein
MRQDFCLESELADSLAVDPRLLRCHGGRELDVLDAKGIQGLGDGDFGFGVEEGVRKLLSLCPTVRTKHEKHKSNQGLRTTKRAINYVEARGRGSHDLRGCGGYKKF